MEKENVKQIKNAVFNKYIIKGEKFYGSNTTELLSTLNLEDFFGENMPEIVEKFDEMYQRLTEEIIEKNYNK